MAFERVFVTGGSGFVGGRLIRALVADGVAVRGLARSERAAEAVAAAGGEPVRGDLADAASLRAGADGCDVAFHAAAHLGDWGRKEDFERDNVAGTRNVLLDISLARLRARLRSAGGARRGVGGNAGVAPGEVQSR